MSARARAFREVPETCPAVDAAAEVAEENIIDELRKLVSAAKSQGTEKLRDALVSAYEEIERLEGRVDELEEELSKREDAANA